MNATLPCPVEGNADLYGLGIRLGIYIQMLAVELSNLSALVLRTPNYLAQATIVFVLATTTVLVRELRAHALQPVEVFPILTLLLAQLRVCRLPPHRGQTTALLYALETLALVALFVWFWFAGMDTLPRACPDDKAFFFAKVSIWHWFRTLNKVSSVAFAVAGSLGVLVYAVAIASFGIFRARNLVRRLRGRPLLTLPPDVDEASKAQSLVSLDSLVNVGVIVYVEMSLRWNRISGVHSLSSAGQFMPFFVSLAQLLAVLYDGARSLLVAAAEVGDPSGHDEPKETECPHGGGWLTKGRDESLPLANIRPS